MGVLKEYVLTLVATAILCAIIQLFFNENKNLLSVVKMVTGVVFVVCAIKPLVSFEWETINDHLTGINDRGNSIVAEAEAAVQMEMQERIIEKTRAYILDEAAFYNTTLAVDVQLNNGSVPEPKVITLYGNVSPYVKKQLSQMLVDDLGITEENQIWK